MTVTEEDTHFGDAFGSGCCLSMVLKLFSSMFEPNTDLESLEHVGITFPASL